MLEDNYLDCQWGLGGQYRSASCINKYWWLEMDGTRSRISPVASFDIGVVQSSNFTIKCLELVQFCWDIAKHVVGLTGCWEFKPIYFHVAAWKQIFFWYIFSNILATPVIWEICFSCVKSLR
jgi:hypothetical protein